MLLLGAGACAGPGRASSAVSGAPASPSAAAPAEGEVAPRLPATVTDLTGHAVTVSRVERLVSLNGDVTEIVFALGLGRHLVGVDTSSSYPAEAAQLPKIGYQRTLHAEGIISLDPSAVVGSEGAGPPAVLEQVRGAGIPVVLAPNPPSLQAPVLKLQLISRALGVPQRGAALAAAVEADLAEARARLQGLTSRPRVLFFYLRGASGAQLVAGRNTSAAAMIEAAGGLNAGAEVGIEGYQPITPEAVIGARPDVYLVLTAGLESVGGVGGLLQIPGLAETAAGQQRRVVALDDLYLLGMVPRSGAAVLELQAALHPQLAAPGGA